MANTDPEENKPGKAPSEQRTSTPEMFNGNLIIGERHMDVDVDHATKGTRCGLAQGSEPVNRGSLQLPHDSCRGLHRPRRHGIAERGGLQADA